MPYIVRPLPPRRPRVPPQSGSGVPRAEDMHWWQFDDQQPTNITIHEDDESQPTGVLDADGNELWRVPERIKMGFVK